MDKEGVRRRIWSLLEERDLVAFPRPCYGRIPNFKGSERAAEKIRELDQFKQARCVFCAPDAVLKRVREIVLEERKVLAVALPHIEGLVEICRDRVHPCPGIFRATTIKGFKKYGRPLETPVDLFVQGSVAVDRFGNRLGKGRGYGDREYQILKSLGLLREGTQVVTIVHELQILDDLRALMDERDVRVDYVITDSAILKTARGSSWPASSS